MRIENQLTEALDNAEKDAAEIGVHLLALVQIIDRRRGGVSASECGDIFDALLELVLDETGDDRIHGWGHLMSNLVLGRARPALTPTDAASYICGAAGWRENIIERSQDHAA